MYDYPHYKERDTAKVLQFMREHPFAMLVATGLNGRAEATQVPVLVEENNGKLFLTAHIAKKSSHEKALREHPEALLIFTGPHTYVSGSWYSGNPQQASTWNYIAVHARGKVRWMDETELIGLLKKLSLHFENGNTSSSTVYDNLPTAYVEKLIKAIIGMEIEVIELDNVHKLSQNRDEKSYDSIVEKLKQGNDDAKQISDIMEARRSKVFPS